MALPVVTYFYVVALSLSLLDAESANVSNPLSLHRRYDKTLEMVTSLYWGNCSDQEQNTLMSPLASARDTTFLLSLIRKKSLFRQYLPLYSGFARDLRGVAEHVAALISEDIVSNTTFYARQEQINGIVKKRINLTYFEESFSLATEPRESELDPSYAIYTDISWHVSMVELNGHMWLGPADFLLDKSSSPLDITALQTVGFYEYAEFEHPNFSNCTFKALRLNYNSEMTINFVLPLNVDIADCTSVQDLWTVMKDVDFRRLNYTNQTMFASIPIFKTKTNVDLKKRLETTTFGETLTLKAEDFRDSVLRHSTSFSFAPNIPNDGPIPMIAVDTPSFFVERPFYVAINHRASQIPLLAGLISNPLMTQE